MPYYSAPIADTIFSTITLLIYVGSLRLFAALPETVHMNVCGTKRTRYHPHLFFRFDIVKEQERLLRLLLFELIVHYYYTTAIFCYTSDRKISVHMFGRSNIC